MIDDTGRDGAVAARPNRYYGTARRARAAYEQAAAQRQAEIEEARQRCRSRELMMAGAAMMSSTSPYAGVGIGQGVNNGTAFAQQNGC